MYLLVATAGTVVLLLLLGLSVALAYGALTGQWAQGLRGSAAALAQLPAILALGGLVVVVFAGAPRWAPALGWAALGASLLMGQLGALLELPQAVLNLSPFTHVPAVPAQPLELLPVLALAGVALLLVAVAGLVFRRRDLAVSA